MGLSFSLVADSTALERLEGTWSALLARSSMDEPMLSPTWLLPWWRVFGPLDQRELRVGVFSDGARVVGIAPLLSRRHWYAPGIPFQRLELLGSGESERDEICSEYLGVIADVGANEAVARALVEALFDGSFGCWDELVLPAMDGSTSFPTALADALCREDATTTLEETSLAPHVTLPPTWGAYLGGLSSSSRYQVNRALRDFEAWAGGAIELRCATSPAELEEGKRALVTLHGRRWGGGGAFASHRFGAFHDAVMPALLAGGALELLWLSARGEPVAALYNVLWKNKIYHYQSGRRMDLPKAIRPGIVAHAYAIRRAIEAGRSEYDFLGGDSMYKRVLASKTRPLVRLRSARRRLRETIRVVAALGMTEAARIRRATAHRRAHAAAVLDSITGRDPTKRRTIG